MRKVLASVLAKDVVFIFRKFRRSEPSHILYQTEYRHVHLVGRVHIYALACIGEGNTLRRTYDYRSGDGECLKQGQMDVACARRCVEDEVVEVSPVRVGNQLLQCRCRHSAAPQRRRGLVDEEADAQQLHPVFLYRLYELPAVLLNGVRTLVLHIEHLWHGRAEYVGVEQSHLVAEACQRDGEICRDGTLAHAALAGTYGYDVLHLWKQLAHLRSWCRFELGRNGYLHLFTHVIVYCSLGSLQRRLQERVCLSREYQRELHLHAVDMQVVRNHLALHEILFRARIHHRGECVRYQFWV